ncbi:MAG: 2-oxoglutarate dehydrogenase E1 component [Rickettsiales bacterium]|nr:2-oxoglutarate dehydrogenase E1 component [Pseudomonadota bacterium]MDA0966982.1 2-oxoglutarate dehydrogenase E1 component [Pseudomonadota bacterium]MDG4543902.1 2-oxoglutarate dehydrogenase E1 component [Rickettsiales bacterium]MDG4546048.1 2-oxoglutarate dehydrogenase E1 component [Rickettsiales bacterium]MDG4548294.1 2-oxoglutarate dehydrogenase E1 component [Rickettsiales bacterium]
MKTDFYQTTPIFGTNSTYLEELYELYLQNPASVDESWQAFFKDMGDSLSAVLKEQQGASWAPRKSSVVGAKPVEAQVAQKPATGEVSEQACRDSIGALMLIRAFKVRGNLLADLDPLGLEGHKMHPDLDPTTYGFTDADYDREIYLAGEFGFERATLRELLSELKQTYASKIGVEFMHLPELERRNWIADRMEKAHGLPELSAEEKITILEDITKVERFEQFLHVKYPGAKRFSVEGGEAVIAAMEKIIERAANLGVAEVVIGMPHRGRLNVLTKVMGRRYASMISEFQGKQSHFSEELDASGDVKYHQGASSDRDFNGHKIHLSLSANPSHLEAVNPVVVGRVRAKQDIFNDAERTKAMGILLHGDAAFCGQGVVTETMALSDLDGYTTGGTIHIVVNNQIGFTTNPNNQRKSPYPTDVAKGAHAPIFHVNGDDPEAVVFVSRLAVEYRQKFKTDVVVDVFCYRRYGHNEGDEPFFTQPIMYNKIKDHPTPMNVYAQKLISEGVISESDFSKMKDDFQQFMEKEYEEAQSYEADEADWLKGSWEGFENPEKGLKKNVDTGVDVKKLKEIGYKLASYPDDFNINKKLSRQMDTKIDMMKSGKNLDWAMGEALAFGTLLEEGHPIRITGQDSVRGTFSHRHAALTDQNSENKYFPLNNMFEKQAGFEVIDSNLSEYAVLGFEYGYSLARPQALVLWEAQFGDFANGAQIMVDQFISSGEAKWLRFSGLVMLLPHGYEGQGPEHSSARLERFLQLCAEDNMQVVNCTTPANLFHVLRRQIHRKFRKPLVVMSPKSLLRHKLCVSDLKDFDKGTHFKRVIGETSKLAANDKIRKVIICSGKVYYDLLEAREERKINDIAIIRLEQYYPFPDTDLVEELNKYKNAEVIWCQEEHQNMGAWHFVDRRIEAVLEKAECKSKRPEYVGRKEAASPAAGYYRIHNKQLQDLLNEALK